jgi:hypothetical protein
VVGDIVYRGDFSANNYAKWFHVAKDESNHAYCDGGLGGSRGGPIFFGGGADGGAGGGGGAAFGREN